MGEAIVLSSIGYSFLETKATIRKIIAVNLNLTFPFMLKSSQGAFLNNFKVPCFFYMKGSSCSKTV